MPKQFLQIVGERSMLQETVSRLQPLLDLEDIFVISSQPYVAEIRKQLPELEERQLIVEPAARNTAPCIGLAAVYLNRIGLDDSMVVLPADHVIRDVAEFHEVLKSAEALADQDWLITFGIKPTFPSTGYGYLECGEDLGRFHGRRAYRVERFLEKPGRAVAEQLLERGGHYWNSGMFVWKTEAILNEMGRRMPGLYAGLREIQEFWEDQERVSAVFSQFEKISIDYGVMERAERIATVPCSLGWSDVGNWNALEEFFPIDPDGISSNCVVEAIDSRDSLVFAEGSRLVALIGIEDLVVVDTPNALLLCPKHRTEDVKKVVDRLRSRGLKKHL
jgi:mannose-1-phosphate guanylyltransferase